jgi:hypothetical protein
MDYTDDSFQLNDNIEDFNSMQSPILPIGKDYHIFISCQSISPDCETADRIDTFLRKKGYQQKRLYFNFHIVNFPFICSNIPPTPVYGVYLSQLIRYFSVRGFYRNVLDRGLVLTKTLLNQGFLVEELAVSVLHVATFYKPSDKS